MSWTYDISRINVKKIVGTLYEKKLQETNQKEFRVEKVIKRKDDKLYAKWKGYNNYFYPFFLPIFIPEKIAIFLFV